MYVCTYVCVCMCVYVCMYVCMYVCIIIYGSVIDQLWFHEDMCHVEAQDSGSACQPLQQTSGTQSLLLLNTLKMMVFTRYIFFNNKV
jgi:hypothetical protein